MSLFDQNLSIFKALKPTYTRKRIGCLGRYTANGAPDPDPRADLPPDYVWVRFDGDRGATRVKNLRVRAAWGTPVWVEFNELTREDEVREVHGVLAPVAFGGAVAAALNVPAIPASLSPPTPARDILPGGVFADENGGLRVRVLPMWSPGGAWWDGTTLLALTPTATANRKSMRVIGIDPLTNSATTALTADRGVAVNLIADGMPTAQGAADLQTVIDAQPEIFWVGAVELAHDATAINPAKIADLRFWRIPALTGADGTNAGRRGLAPAPAAADHTKYLRGDATWADINGSINWGTPGALGGATPNTGAFTTLTTTGDLTVGGAGSLSGRVMITPGASQRGIDMQLNATPGDALRVRSSGGTTLFGVNSFGRASYRVSTDDNNVFNISSAGGSVIYQMGTLTSSTLFLLTGLAGQTGDYFRARDSGGSTLFSVAGAGKVISTPRSAITSQVSDTLTLGHNTSGAPGAGFGGQIALALESSTTENTLVGSIDWQWDTATHATRVPDLVIKLTDHNAAREILRLRANGSAGAVGFFGAAPAARQTGGAATAGAAYGATEQTMLQVVYDALRTYGLLT